MRERRRKKKEEVRWRNWGIFKNMKNIDSILLGFLYFGNSLRSIERGSGRFFQQHMEALKMVFGVRSIRVLTQLFVGSLL